MSLYAKDVEGKVLQGITLGIYIGKRNCYEKETESLKKRIEEDTYRLNQTSRLIDHLDGEIEKLESKIKLD